MLHIAELQDDDYQIRLFNLSLFNCSTSDYCHVFSFNMDCFRTGTQKFILASNDI